MGKAISARISKITRGESSTSQIVKGEVLPPESDGSLCRVQHFCRLSGSVATWTFPLGSLSGTPPAPGSEVRMVNRPWTSKQGPPEGLRKLSPGAVHSHSKEGRRRASQRECVSFRSESLSPLLGGGVVGSATLCELWDPASSCPPPVHPLLRQRGYLAPGALSGGRSPTVGEPFTGQQHQTESTCFRVNASLLLRVFPSFLSLLLLAPPCPRLYLTAPRHVTPSLHVREKNPNSTAGRGKSFPHCACSRFLEHRSLTSPPLYTQNSARCVFLLQMLTRVCECDSCPRPLSPV